MLVSWLKTDYWFAGIADITDDIGIAFVAGVAGVVARGVAVGLSLNQGEILESTDKVTRATAYFHTAYFHMGVSPFI